MSKLRVKEILKEKGITGREFALKIGMTEVGFYKLLSDTGNPPLKRLYEISEALEVPITELFDDSAPSAYTCPHCGGELNVEIKG